VEFFYERKGKKKNKNRDEKIIEYVNLLERAIDRIGKGE